ncbi:SDR family oxidoreductase [Rickettsiella endosymbiont of Dermanyssus gallinae]|uniref:SDR family oxidoreductase n=1 Tax=Rickettsiella endosymbiont of Dermanyssus gallinae TaxID=2856608 RepID=UPI001C52F605|nr:SDR family oxidoreductase [Rickettsiella endosymbiont of Dermanyssus gallinae]
MNLELKNKVVLIAGASQGIGYATALAFAREDARVAICARDKATIEQAAKKIQDETNADISATAVDLTQAEAIQHWVDSVLKQFKTIHICITNVGGPPKGAFVDLDDKKWQEAFELTLMSAVRLSRAVIPTMKEQKWGRIIHLCSSSVRNPIANLGLSNSIRSAVVALSKTQADELAKDNILVNSILTGWTRTEQTNHILETMAKNAKVSAEEVIAKRESVIPLGRMGKPEEIAAPIVFLSSAGANFITESTITVDGGESRFPF